MIAALLMAAALGAPPPIWGDFDHDGRRDRAAFVRARNGDYKLVVWRAINPKRPVLVDAMGDSHGEDLYLTKAAHGRWRTACAKGYDLGPEQCRYMSVRVRGDVLDYGTKEASESLALWNGRRFEIVAISD